MTPQQPTDPQQPTAPQEPAQPAQPAYAPTNGMPQQALTPAPAPAGQPQAAHINNHRVLAIVSILFSLLFGLFALVNSMNVDKAIQAGDYAKAEACSKHAKNLAIIGIVLSIIVNIGYFASTFAAQSQQ